MLNSKDFSVNAKLATAGLIVFGTTVSTLHKAAYDLEVVGLSGIPQHFEKPWAMMLCMFLGMSLCLPAALRDEFQKAKDATAGKDNEVSLWQFLTSPAELQTIGLLAIPAVFDIGATLLMNIGLLSVTASVYQMLRGAGVLFSALFTVQFLKRNLNKLHYGGIALAVAGVGAVGVASLLSGEGSAGRDISQTEMLMGIGLIVIGQAVQAAQFVFEDYVMSEKGIPSMKVIAYEGVMGSVATVAGMAAMTSFVDPSGVLKGVYEDSADTLMMLHQSPGMLSLLAVTLLAFTGLNISGMKVTEEMGGSFRTVLEMMRTLFIWMVGLALFYNPFASSAGSFGESWTDYSFIQLAGFVVMASGTLLYGKGNHQLREDNLVAAAAKLEAALLLDEQPAGEAQPVGAAPKSAASQSNYSSAPPPPQSLEMHLLPALAASTISPVPATPTSQDNPWDRFPPCQDLDDSRADGQPAWDPTKPVPVFVTAKAPTPLEYVGLQGHGVSNGATWGPSHAGAGARGDVSAAVGRGKAGPGVAPPVKHGLPLRRTGGQPLGVPRRPNASGTCRAGTTAIRGFRI